MGINLKRLATELNLSISTVSRALQDSHQVSEKTKQKVLALAKQLNFEPNPNASSLRRQKSKTIAVVIPDIDSNFNSQVIYGIEEAAQLKGYHVLLYFTHEDVEKERDAIRHLLSGRADGILMSVSSQSINFDHLTETLNKIPIVFFDRTYEALNASSVSTNDYKSSIQATHHLLDNGCKRLAYLKGSNKLSNCQQRLDGFTETLKERGVKVDHELILSCTYNKEHNYNTIKDLLSSKNSPDGIFAANEKLALTCYQVCHDLKIPIPEKLKIIAFSNLETAPLLAPSLSTITRPAFEMGKEATRILLQMLKTDNKNYLENIVLDTNLEERGSTSNK